MEPMKLLTLETETKRNIAFVKDRGKKTLLSISADVIVIFNWCFNVIGNLLNGKPT